MLVTHALINMAVAVGVFPVTGQPLPLISRGGTSTFVNCAYIGIMLSVSRSARKVEEANAEEIKEPEEKTTEA
jgi:cell division protein FtsW